MEKLITVSDLLEKCKLELITGRDGLTREVGTAEINRPGLVLAGHSSHYSSNRIQILGSSEMSFIEDQLSSEDKITRFDVMCTVETPCIIVSRGATVPQELIDAANVDGVPVLRSHSQTTKLISVLTNYLESEFAPSTSVHGVFVDIAGVGVLMIGSSGVGKSEAALELVQRGHRLVADDSVDIKRLDTELIGEAPEILNNHLEIRGLGILNIMKLFGAGSVKKNHPISLVIELEPWEKGKYYDRIGLDSNFTNILGLDVDKIIIPIRPGRNVAMIIEVAAMNYNLKSSGHDSAQEFTKKLNELIANNSVG